VHLPGRTSMVTRPPIAGADDTGMNAAGAGGRAIGIRVDADHRPGCGSSGRTAKLEAIAVQAIEVLVQWACAPVGVVDCRNRGRNCTQGRPGRPERRKPRPPRGAVLLSASPTCPHQSVPKVAHGEPVYRAASLGDRAQRVLPSRWPFSGKLIAAHHRAGKCMSTLGKSGYRFRGFEPERGSAACSEGRPISLTREVFDTLVLPAALPAR